MNEKSPPGKPGEAKRSKRPQRSSDHGREQVESSSRSVAKALAVLEYVALEELTTIAQLSNRTGLPRSTLYRLIGTLIDQGFLYRTAHGHYRASFKLWRIGSTAVHYDSIRENARAVLNKLVNETSETAHYSVYEDGYAVYVEKLDGLHPIRSYTAIGGRSPAYATATGKALLAWQDEAEIARVAHSARCFTGTTVTKPADILAEMKRIRESGYAINRGEWRDGVWGIAAPALGPAQDILAAVGISGPEDRFKGALEQLTAKVCRAASELSQHDVSPMRSAGRRS
jgi:DNA-binding IclR family transcriptional regulator